MGKAERWPIELTWRGAADGIPAAVWLVFVVLLGMALLAVFLADDTQRGPTGQESTKGGSEPEVLTAARATTFSSGARVQKS